MVARLALIKGGIVQHVISVDADFAVFSDTANAGWSYEPSTGLLSAPPQPPVDDTPSG